MQISKGTKNSAITKKKYNPTFTFHVATLHFNFLSPNSHLTLTYYSHTTHLLPTPYSLPQHSLLSLYMVRVSTAKGAATRRLIVQ